MISQLYYLGPPHTWSHAAALRARRTVEALTTAELIPLGSAKELFDQITADPNTAAIIPTYNLEQGIVYDFARFHIFDEIGSLELKTRMCLFSQEETVSSVRRIYTKDTVLPQVSRWLEALPDHIEIIARPDISTARGVQMAAAEAGAAAICSEAAGRAYNLRPLALGIANNKDNYTAFSVFQRGQWFNPTELAETAPEYGFGITQDLVENAKEGRLNVLWHLSSTLNRQLHIGHLSAILTLKKLALLGNRLIIQIEHGDNQEKLKKQLASVFCDLDVVYQTAPDRLKIYNAPGVTPQLRHRLEKRADISGSGRIKGREELRTKLFCNHQVLIDSVKHTGVDLVVAGPSLLPDLKMLAELSNQIIPTILVDYLPGTDHYAKMSASRNNLIYWPIQDQTVSLPRPMLHMHFADKRLHEAKLELPIVT